MRDTNRPRIRPLRVVALVLLLGLLPSPPTLGDERCPDGNLLAGRLPRQPAGILHPERLTDGVAAIEGDDWQVDLVSYRFDPMPYSATTSGATCTYAPRSCRAIIQDRTSIEGSIDGRAWVELWRTPAADGTGLAITHDVRARPCASVSASRESPTARSVRIDRAADQLCNRQDAWPTVEIRAGSTDLAAVELRERYRQQQAGHKLNVGLLGGIGFVSLLLAARRDQARIGLLARPCRHGTAAPVRDRARLSATGRSRALVAVRRRRRRGDRAGARRSIACSSRGIVRPRTGALDAAAALRSAASAPGSTRS